jgi:hypothetical protein
MQTFVILLEFVVIPIAAIAVAVALFTRGRGGRKPGGEK